MKQTAAQLLVRCLEMQECRRIFTVPGESFLPVLDALHDDTSIETVVCRQEGGAAFMACADGSITQRPGVAFVTRGPGATNASIGVHVAMQDSQPMILFVGDVARPMRDREGFQEMDFGAFFAPICKWSARIDDAARIPEYVARAYATAISGRPGPVVLALPEDMLSDEVEGCEPRPFLHRPAQAPCPDALAAMMAMIGDAASPVAIVGGAGWNAKAREHFTAFAEDIGLPVATAFRRQDAISPDSPVYAGNTGYGPNHKLVERIREADLLLVVGARLGEATTDGYELVTLDHPGQQLIHVHPDPEELGRVYRADLAICADMGEFAEGAALWDHDILSFDAGRDAHEEWRAFNTPGSDGTRLDLAQCLAAARDILPPDSVICNGAGNFSSWWHRYWPYKGFPSQMAPTAGAMGYGVPAAVAAKMALPDRCVVAVAGDGDFLMNGQELATAAQDGLDLIVIIVDNGTYGTIRMHQEREFPARVSGTSLSNPDFAALGEAFGARSWKVETAAEFKTALSEAAAGGGLRVLHCLQEQDVIAASGVTIDGLRSR